MERVQRWQSLPALGFALLCAAVSAVGLSYTVWFSTQQMNAVAKVDAQRWSLFVRDEFPEVSDLARGSKITPHIRNVLDGLSAAGGVRAIRVYNAANRVMIQSGTDDQTIAAPSAGQDILTVSQPLVEGGVGIGRFEVDVDSTPHYEALSATVMHGAAATLVSLLVAMLAGFFLLQRQHNRTARQLDQYAQHDQLTGLPNHSSFQKSVGRQIEEAQLAGSQGSLILCEVADLSVVGQNYGLQGADNAVTLTAQRLSDMKLANCEIGAIAFGRFGLYISRVSDAMEVLAIAKGLTAKLSQPLLWHDEAVPLAVHSGIALSPTDGATAEELIHSAELALRLAQDQGSQGYSFFNPSIAHDARRRVAVQRALTDALAQQSFRLDFQPVYEFQSGQLSGFEALLRLHDAELGAISPAEFIPIAEQSNQINRIGAWCLLEACQIAAQWPAHLVVAVNLSPSQFYCGTLISDVREALSASRLPSYRLEVEITEGTLLKESELVLQQLGVLRDMGVSVALDDFGTGYSSLSYLWKFPFSKIKIDRSFVNALGDNQNARGILRTIIKLGHGLGLTVTAEGIETEAQFATLRDLHCNLAQGYLLDRPARVADLAAIILRNFANGLTRKASLLGSASDRKARSA